MSRSMVARATYVSVEMMRFPHLTGVVLAQTPTFTNQPLFILPYDGLREVVARVSYTGANAAGQPVFRVFFSSNQGSTEENETITDPTVALTIVQPFGTQKFYARERLGPVIGVGALDFDMPITVPRGVNSLRIRTADISAVPGTVSIVLTAGTAGT